jgi:Ca2+/Na+ antiporter
LAVASRRQAAAPSRALSWTQLALWNSGTAAVAGADIARILPGVVVGSAILLIALVLFLAALRQTRRTARRRSVALEHRYLALLVVLAGCVVLGTFLAGAVPGQ